jgi:alpha-beta hydrolase superfamily lysophospholipase
MTVGALFSTREVKTPLLIIGGKEDRICPPKDVFLTARAYGTEPVLIADMGHEMMVEPGWAIVASHIESWLAQRGL